MGFELNNVLGDPNFYCRIRDDFLGSALSTNWTQTVSGIGAFSNIDTTYRNGVVRLTAGSSGANEGIISWAGTQINPAYIRYLKFRFQLINSGNENHLLGIANAALTDGIGLQKIAGAAWTVVTRSGGVSTSSTTTVLADAAWHTVEIFIKDTDIISIYSPSNLNAVVFRLDYTETFIHTTNIPTANLNMFFRSKTTAAVNRTILLDYVDMYTEREL